MQDVPVTSWWQEKKSVNEKNLIWVAVSFSANTVSKVSRWSWFSFFPQLNRLVRPSLHPVMVTVLFLYRLTLAKDIQAFIKWFIVKFILDILTRNHDTNLVYVTAAGAAAPSLQPLPGLVFLCLHTLEGLHFWVDSHWWLLLHVSFSVLCILYCHSVLS